MNLQISFIIYLIIIISLIVYKVLFRLISIKIKISDYVYLGLNKYQMNFLIISSILYLLLFYFLKSFVTDTNIDYILPLGIFYIIWYLLTKIITNSISEISDSI
jgi:hypothetical protein